VFGEFVAAYWAADIRVECHVQHIPADTASVRMIAVRAGQLGFVATQRSAVDVIDVYTVSPYDLGQAISDALSLTQPGQHSRIADRADAHRRRGAFDTDNVVVRDSEEPSSEVLVPRDALSAYATVQSHWRPARRWGFDRNKSAVVWVRVTDDGEYIYALDRSHAVPMSRAVLRQRIDQLIADDVVELREFRGD
jgi:hypothetical protein